MIVTVAAKSRIVSRSVSNWLYVRFAPKWAVESMDMAGQTAIAVRLHTKHEAEAECAAFNHAAEGWPPEKFEDKKSYSVRRMTRNQILKERDNERADQGSPELSG